MGRGHAWAADAVVSTAATCQSDRERSRYREWCRNYVALHMSAAMPHGLLQANPAKKIWDEAYRAHQRYEENITCYVLQEIWGVFGNEQARQLMFDSVNAMVTLGWSTDKGPVKHKKTGKPREGPISQLATATWDGEHAFEISKVDDWPKFGNGIETFQSGNPMAYAMAYAQDKRLKTGYVLIQIRAQNLFGSRYENCDLGNGAALRVLANQRRAR